MRIITLVTLDELAKIVKVSRGTLLSWLSHFTLSKYLYKLEKQYHFILTDNSRKALYEYFLLKTKKDDDIILKSKLYIIEGFELTID